MLRALAVLVSLGFPVAAQAFSQCDTSVLAGPGARVFEEGSNPVASNNYVHAGYTLRKQVVVVTSSDRGETLGAPVTIFTGQGRAGQLRLAVSHANVYAVWVQRLRSGGRDLMFDASHDHGTADGWDAPIDFGAAQGDLPQIAVDGDNVHIAFLRADKTVIALNSTDDGRTFSAPVAIALGWGEIVAASRGQDVYVSWNDYAASRFDVIMAVSHDGGATFDVQNLSASRPSSAREPIFGLDQISGRLSLVWREDVPIQGVYLQSLDAGTTWSDPLPIDTPARQFMVADDGTYIYLSYLKDFTIDGVSDWQIYLATSTDGGASFPSRVNLSGPTGIVQFTDDDQRPIPWILDGNGALRLTGVEADGVHVWNGRHGHMLAPVYLGAGDTASPAARSVLWNGPNKTVMYGVCH